MSTVLKLSTVDVLRHLKFSCQLPSLLESIATQKIIVEAAGQAGIKVEAEELQQAADSLRLTNNLLKAEDTWEWLKKYYLTLDDFEEIAYVNLISNKLAVHLFDEVAERFFYENQTNYTSAVIYEAILDDEDLALELFYSLQEGEISFQQIARTYIQNPEVRRAGGYQGIRKRSEFRPEIATAIFAAQPPQILKPIVTPKGVHLIAVEEIIKPQLDEQLKLKIIGDLFTAWLKQQCSKLEITAVLESESLSTKAA